MAVAVCASAVLTTTAVAWSLGVMVRLPTSNTLLVTKPQLSSAQPLSAQPTLHWFSIHTPLASYLTPMTA